MVQLAMKTFSLCVLGLLQAYKSTSVLGDNPWHIMVGHGGLPRAGKQAQALRAAKLLMKTPLILHKQRLIARKLKEGLTCFLPSLLAVFAGWRAIPFQNDHGKGSHGSSWISHPSSNRAGVARQAGVYATFCCSAGPAKLQSCGFRKESKRPLLGDEKGWEVVRTTVLPISSLKDTSRVPSTVALGGL